MSRTESTMVQLGTRAPDFQLLDVRSGRTTSRDDLVATGGNQAHEQTATTVHGSQGMKHGLLIMFVCPHCPYVKHVEEELGRLGRDYAGQVAIAAMMPNDLEQYPEDSPDRMREQANRCGWTFAYLLDETQEVARRFNAACTPDLFLYNREMRLVYRGQLDGSRPRRGDYGNEEPVTGKDLRAALDAVIAGKEPDPDQRGSIGCNIKWRPGHEA